MFYPVAFEQEMTDNGLVFGAIVPDLLGCVSTGDSFTEAYENIIEAINAHLALMAEDGDDIPVAKGIDDYINDPDYSGLTWAMVPIDITRYLGKSEKINVTLPQRLIHLIDNKVANNKERYKTRSGYLAMLAERDLSLEHHHL